MGRKIGMVLYWGIGIVLIFLAYVIGYNSGASNKYYELLQNAVNENSHVNICKSFSMYGIPFDSVALYDSETEHNQIVIYNAVNQINLSYKDSEDKTINSSNIEFVYYLFIYSPQFDNLTINDTTNLSGLKFYNDSDESFKFNFFVSEKVNSSELYDKVTNPTESLFNTSRDTVATYSKYGFIFTSISETFVNHVNESIGSISKLELIDSNGYKVGDTINVNLDFSQQFYQDMEDFKIYSQTYNELVDKSDKTTEERKELDEAEKYINEFAEKFDNGEYSDTYLRGYLKSDIYNAQLVWSSIGIAALFTLVLALIFILLFYFKRIKKWVFKDHSSRNRTRVVPNRRNPNETATEVKNNYDRMNAQRKIDQEKKRKKAEEIRKSGNSIIRKQEDDKIDEASIIENNEENQNLSNDVLDKTEDNLD